MLAKTIYIVSALALASVVCADPLQRINDYIVDHETSKDADANLERMKDMLADKDATKSSLLHRDVKPALEQLLRLPELAKDCSFAAYEELYPLGKQVLGHQRRIDNVIRHYLNQHSANCEKTYIKKIEEAEARLGDKFVENIEKFSKEVIDAQVRRYQLGHGAPYYDAIWELTAVGLPMKKLIEEDGTAAYWTAYYNGDAEPAYKAVFEKAKDAEGKLLYTEKDAKTIYENVVVTPCRQYVDALHDAIIVPRTLDQFHIGNRDSEYNYTDFLFPSTRYHLCTLLLDSEKTVLKGYLKVAKKRLDPQEW